MTRLLPSRGSQFVAHRRYLAGHVRQGVAKVLHRAILRWPYRTLLNSAARLRCQESRCKVCLQVLSRRAHKTVFRHVDLRNPVDAKRPEVVAKLAPAREQPAIGEGRS